MKPGYIAGIAVSLFALSGCTGPQPDEVLLPRTDISLTVKGEVQMAYNPYLCQIGYNRQNHEFRLVNDKIRDWVIFRSEAPPTDVGQKVKAYLEYTVADNTKRLDGIVFTVEKTDSDGRVWLWNKDKKIGIIIKTL